MYDNIIQNLHKIRQRQASLQRAIKRTNLVAVMVILLLLLGKTLCLSQCNNTSYEVWNTFLQYSTANQKSTRIYIMDSVSNSNEGLDKVSSHYFEKKILTGEVHDSYGRQLKDTSWLALFRKYDLNSESSNSELRDFFDKNLRIKFLNIKNFKRFARKKKPYEILVTFSDCIFDDSCTKCVFYCEKYRGKLDGSGHIIFMEKINNKWVISYLLRAWVS